jgi:hypothetical protein
MVQAARDAPGERGDLVRRLRTGVRALWGSVTEHGAAALGVLDAFAAHLATLAAPPGTPG